MLFYWVFRWQLPNIVCTRTTFCFIKERLVLFAAIQTERAPKALASLLLPLTQSTSFLPEPLLLHRVYRFGEVITPTNPILTITSQTVHIDCLSFAELETQTTSFQFFL